MLLPPREAKLFFRLHKALLFFVNRHAGVLPADSFTPEGVVPPVKELAKLRNALLERTGLLDLFLEQNPAGLSGEELAIVSSWRHRRTGKFCVFRELKKYTVLLSSDKPPVAYGVTGLTQTFDELIGPSLPALIEAVLLPFRDKIIHDGLFTVYRISFGPGIRQEFNEKYQEAKARLGIVTSLPPGPADAPKGDK